MCDFQDLKFLTSTSWLSPESGVAGICEALINHVLCAAYTPVTTKRLCRPARLDRARCNLWFSFGTLKSLSLLFNKLPDELQNRTFKSSATCEIVFNFDQRNIARECSGEQRVRTLTCTLNRLKQK